jgi:hypothetical protein
MAFATWLDSLPSGGHQPKRKRASDWLRSGCVRSCGVVFSARTVLTHPSTAATCCRSLPSESSPGTSRVGFVVSNQPAMHHQPPERSFYRPALALRLEPTLLRVFSDDLHVDTVLRAQVNDALLVPRVHPRHRHRGVLTGHLLHHPRPQVVSCTLAAVTNTTNNRPSTSVATCRLRPLTFLPASIPANVRAR